MQPTEIYSPGLEGVIAGETAISTVTGGLRYRGYPVIELAEHCSFDETAYLLLYGELPNARELADFQARLVAARKLPDLVLQTLKVIPRQAASMDAIRTAISLLAHFDPDTEDPSKDPAKVERLLGQIPVAIAARHRFLKGLEPVEARNDLGHAAHFLYLLNGKEPTAFDAKAFDVSLILYAEHEFNASTFTARVVTSTESDLHSSIVAAVGALKGRLHGGANEKVMDLLQQTGGPANAEAWLRAAMARKEKIMGFGHRVYKTGDIRAKVLKEYSRQAAEGIGDTRWEETAAIFENILATEKNLFPNLDWPAGRLYHSLGLEVPLYTPIFVASRVVGWGAHVIEQAKNNRIIRPRARYTGPDEKKVLK